VNLTGKLLIIQKFHIYVICNKPWNIEIMDFGNIVSSKIPLFYHSISPLLFLLSTSAVHKSNSLLNTAYLALGSNRGDKLMYLKKAVEEINKKKDCKVISVSSVYETKPYGNIEQANFFNCAAEIKTSKSLLSFFHFLKEIENELGRTKTIKWGPREIDLDLLFFNHEIYSDDELKVPHKGIPNRDFVIVPLCEIAPNFIHPELNLKICDICNSEKNIIKKLQQKIF
jgi:2-amino-4-hydroxy-6-hydroxymethyldihydropteridine diphosphokinase